jgi:DNA-binding XRE family transcriptional regulator
MNKAAINSFLKSIAIRLSGSRKFHRLTQEEVAFQVNISLRSYQRIENGEIAPKIKVLSDICKVLNLSLSEICKGESILKNYEIYSISKSEAKEFFSINQYSESDIYNFFHCVEMMEQMEFQNSSIKSIIKDPSFNRYDLNFSNPDETRLSQSLMDLLGVDQQVVPSGYLVGKETAKTMWKEGTSMSGKVLITNCEYNLNGNKYNMEVIYCKKDAENSEGIWVHRDISAYKEFEKLFFDDE